MNSTPSHHHVQPSRTPVPGPQRPATVWPTLRDIIARDPRAMRGLDDRPSARTPR